MQRFRNSTANLPHLPRRQPEFWVDPFISMCADLKASLSTSIKCSRNSLRRFVRLFWGLNDTEYWFHQTLTFPTAFVLANEAPRKTLKRLLDSLEKRFPKMGCLWVEERQQQGSPHFHVLFLFYGAFDATPDQMRQNLSLKVFSLWNRLTSGLSVRQANLMTKPKGRAKSFTALWYLTKDVDITDSQTGGAIWNGQRGRSVLKANSVSASKVDISDVLNRLRARRLRNPASESAPPPLKKMSDVRRLKEYADAFDKDWEAFKRFETGKTGKVSDEGYLIHLNKELKNQHKAHRRRLSRRKDASSYDFYRLDVTANSNQSIL